MEGPGVFVSNSREFGRGESTEEVIMETTSSSTVEVDCKHVQEYVTAFEHRRAYGSWLEQEQKQCTSEEEFLTAVANPTWTEVAPLITSSALSTMSLDDQRLIQVMNQQFFKERIKKQREYHGDLNNPLFDYAEFEKLILKPEFFMDFGGRLVLGKKIAQGGQAEIYEALFDGKEAVIQNGGIWHLTNKEEISHVLKVFPLEHSEWFRGAWANDANNILPFPKFFGVDACCFVMNCTLLSDGRFAFLMRRYWGDLRKAINIQILKDKTHLKPPFPPSISTFILFEIAMGMKLLHEMGTLHRDLKAANVLVREDIETSMRLFENHLGAVGRQGLFSCQVADFESAEGVMGTGFWRAPEVLRILRRRAENKYTDPTIWSEKVDVYSFAMTCYEVLTGCIPFQFRRANDNNIGDERPPLPDYVDEEIQNLLRRCWDSEPSKRPSFSSICDELYEFKGKKRRYCESIGEDKRDADAKEWLRFW